MIQHPQQIEVTPNSVVADRGSGAGDCCAVTVNVAGVGVIAVEVQPATSFEVRS
jgi:hypothetical protein